MKKIYLLFSFLFAFVSLIFGQTTINFTTAGAGTFTAPPGVTSITVETRGGGGGGGGQTATASAGGGGGGGGYASAVIAVTPGTTYNFTVGAAGTGGTTAGTNGATGGTSSFDGGVVSAAGGSGGEGSTTATPGNGGTGGAGLTGAVLFSGGNGSAAVASTASGAGGGGAGTTANGGNASGTTAGTGGALGGGNGATGRTTAGTGTTGSAPGGGGSGGMRLATATARAGGSGGAGRISITYSNCIPYATSNASHFSAFATTGGATNITNNASGFSANGYGDFTAQTLTAQQTGIVNFTTTIVGPTVGVAIFIDFNDDGVFNLTDERVYNTGVYVSTANGSFSIPLSAPIGIHRMRVILDFNATSPNPCAFASGRGEAEDYTVNVTAAPACIAPSGLVVTPTSTTSASATFSGPGTSFILEYGPTGFTPGTNGTAGTNGTIVPGSASPMSVPGLMPNTNYDVYVRQDCSGNGDGYSANSPRATLFTGFCIPVGTSNLSYFSSFTTTNGTLNISNTASGYAPAGYQDASAQIVSQAQGGSVNFSTTIVGPTVGVAIWVDFNDNLTFEASERLFNTGAYVSTATGTLTVPAGAPIGDHRMRVMLDFNASSPTPCAFASGGRGEVEDYTFRVVAPAPCGGTISGGTATSSISTACAPGNTILNATGTSTGSGITYQWQSSPAGANNFTDINGATTVPYTAAFTASTDYQLVVTCANEIFPGTSNIVTVTMGTVPTNDLVCNAIPMVVDGATECGNTTCATSSGDPAFVNSGPNNTVWYTFTPPATGTYQLNFTRPVGVTTGLLYGWLAIYTATGTCPGALTFTEVTSNLSWNLPTTPSVTLSSPTLTGGVTYYLMVDGFSGASGAYCFQITTPPTPPTCTTNISPADGATGVSTIPNVTFTWNAAPTATSYDLYVGTTVANATLIANYTTTSGSVVGFSASTQYFWYVVPRNGGGAATGCSASATSFTTSAQCNPSTTNGGTSGDALTDFVINGESGTAISVLGAPQIAAPGYIDLSGSTTVDLAVGKAYAGRFSAQDASDYLTIWIDFNGNGGFEANERVLNNLRVAAAATSTPYSVMIPATATPGVYKMRVRNIYYGTAPTLPTDPCGGYTYGEGKDFTVNIVATGTPYVVSNAGGGACSAIAATTIDASSNNQSVMVPILDATGGIVAMINANGNNLGRVASNLYRNTSGTVRSTPGGQRYLDRNITINVGTQPASAVTLRLFLTAAELAALQAVDPSITSVSSLNVNKTSAACAATIAGAATLLPQSGSGSFGSDYFVDVANTSFSSFFIAGATVVVPVTFDYFTGRKQATNNLLDWKIACNTGVTITLERSADKVTFAGLNTQTATSTRCLQPFSYVDAAPLSGNNYYRLKVVSASGDVKYSNVVLLISKEKGFEFVSLVPNPVKATAVLSISSASAGRIELNVSDAKGQVIMKQTVTAIAGNNPVTLDLSALAAGTYQVTAITPEGERKATRFVKY